MIAHSTPLSDWVVILPVVLGLAGAALLLMLRSRPSLQAPLAALVVLAIAACDALLVWRVGESGPLAMTMGNWLPPFGVTFAADAFGSLFAFLAALVTLVVLIALQMDTPETATRDGLYPLILLLLAGVGGAFLTGDLFNLYVWFEVMLIASFGLLIIAGNPLQLDAAVKYAVLNLLATSLFLLALGLLYGLLGTLNMADIIGRGEGTDRATLAAIATLFLLAFGMKAAAFPVNAWLPASYHAPPPAIAALIAGLLTKVGLYALIRTLVFVLPGEGALLRPVLFAVAAATALLGPLGAIAETNLRRAIGFMLIGGVGVTLVGAATPNVDALAGSTFYIAHAIPTITALYLVAGLIEKLTGAADSRHMGGLYAASSALSLLFLALILAVSGIPPFLGFWPKLLLLTGVLQQSGIAGAVDTDGWALLLALVVLLNALLTLIAGSRLWSHIFWRPAPTKVRQWAARERFVGVGAAGLLALGVVGLGLWPAALADVSVRAATGLLEPAPYISAVGLAP